jgi:hypothetical protein
MTQTSAIECEGTNMEAKMIYSEDDGTLVPNMYDTVYPTGQSDVMTDCIRRLRLYSEHVERFLAATKEASLV